MNFVYFPLKWYGKIFEDIFQNGLVGPVDRKPLFGRVGRADPLFEWVGILPTQYVNLEGRCRPTRKFLVIFDVAVCNLLQLIIWQGGTSRPTIWAGHQITNPTHLFGGAEKSGPTRQTWPILTSLLKTHLLTWNNVSFKINDF